MARLTDTQLILLTTASQCDNGSLLPLPKTLSDPPGAPRSIRQLIRRGYAEERITTAKTLIWRADDGKEVGAFLSDKGRAALDAGDRETAAARSVATNLVARKPSPPGVKRDTVISLLQRDGGATIDELIAATGWLPHTTRAALSGIRKNGHAVERRRVDDITRYLIAAAAS